MIKKRGYNLIVKKFILIYVAFTSLIIFVDKDATAMDFTQFQWKNRLLFLFAPDSDDPLYKQLLKEIAAQKAEVDDRDLVVFKILEQGPSQMNSTLLDQPSVDSIRGRYSVSRDQFAIILVGKDGGIKLKRNDRTELKDIFGLIDSMPMRQNEMRQKAQRP
jgi:hypothetical protein